MNWRSLFQNPTLTNPTEWWRDIPVGSLVKVLDSGPDRKFAGMEGTFQGYSKGYAELRDKRGRRLLVRPESLGPAVP